MNKDIRKRHHWLSWRKLLIFISIIIILSLSVVAYLYFSTRNPTQGTLYLNGLSGFVKITRDRHGIPHIKAFKSDNDAFFGLGFVHAQDRFWQMEMQRRIAAGRLSEIFGKTTLANDKYLRTWGFYRAARASLKSLDKRTRAIIRSYTAGVNAFLKTQNLPLAFKILRYTPDPWTDVDSVAWQKMMAWDLQNIWQNKLKNAIVKRRFGEKFIDILQPPYPANAPTVLTPNDINQTLFKSNTQANASKPQAVIAATYQKLLKITRKLKRQLNIQQGSGVGSNSWVISGNRTTTGKPMLASDPHLGLQAPNLWYLVSLAGPTLNVIGGSIPGTPAIAIGHNQNIAWGITNVNPDSQDLMIIPKSAKLKTIQSVIKVKGEADVIFPIQISTDGPLISNITDAKRIGPRIAIKWPALMADDTTMQSFIKLNYAKNWQDFKMAVNDFVAPPQNILYADTAGNIGYYLAGKIPMRNYKDTRFPVPADSQHLWTGYIPFEKMPHTFNPTRGFIISANNKSVPDNYPYQITYRWFDPPFRAKRILNLLMKKDKLSLQDMQSIQTDINSRAFLKLKPLLLSTKPLDKSSQTALKILTTWDGNMTRNSIAATVYAYWLKQLAKLKPEHLPVFQKDPNVLFIVQQLKDNGRFCRQDKITSCRQFLQVSLQKAMHKLTKEHGNNQDNWRWGTLHRARFNFLGLGKVTGLGSLLNRRIDSPGGLNTVNAGNYRAKHFAQTLGAGYRQIVSLDNLSKSLYIQALGQSANPFSSHYADLMPRWRDGRYVAMLSAELTKGKKSVLVLKPKIVQSEK